jgi:hypothetical protein
MERNPRWWWTIGRFGLCDSCGVDVTGVICAYDDAKRAVLCASCADEAGVASECRESRRARRARRARQERLIGEWS